MSGNAEACRRWRAKNLERERERSRQWYATHRDRSVAAAMAWNKANPERHRAIRKRYYDKNRERILAAQRSRRAAAKARGKEPVDA